VESIWHEVWIKADRERVFEALTTSAGLDPWWGKVLSAEPRIGHVVEFDHGLGAPMRMEIIELVPNERLVWRCVSDFSDPSNPASEWLGQTFVFELDPRGDVELLGASQNVTVLRFRNTGWPVDSRWRGFCNTGWGEALGVGLRNLCEAGADAASHD
jgi:uncharacterized protein YndB with AHSA1/START domain